MNINSIANQINTANYVGDSNSEVALSSDAKLSMIEQSLQNGFDILNSLSVGSTISGRVVMSEEDMILLSLGPDKLLEAKVSSDLIPKEGQLMTFLVNSTSSKNISLSPMFVNLNPDSNVSAALKNAGLPDNPKMQYMVKAMMEEGLPISKESLFAMNRQVNEFPEFDPKMIATMTRLEMPVNPQMLTQFSNYLNYEHQITNTLGDVTDAFSESVAMLIENDNPSEVLNFAKDVLANLFPETLADETADNSINNAANNVVNNTQLNEILLEENSFNKEPVANALKNFGVLDSDINTLLSSDSDKNNVNTAFKNVINNIVNSLENKLSENAKHESLAKDISTVLSSDKFKAVFKEELSNKFLLKPEEVSHKENVSALYERLNSQIKSLTNALSSSTLNNTPLSEAVNNVNNNLNFMNELNQTFNYVQIPLKLNNKDASGELYVYTNKKSLAQNDGNVSALLHLDMDYLGPVDVHVMMNEMKNVKTKFFLKDDEALDLIASNIDILNKRLENRGYSMSSEFVTKDDDKSVFKTMIESSKNISVISTSSFDAKA